MAPLWVQKPVEPVRFYLARFGEGALASVGLSVVIMSVIIPVALWSGWEPVTHPLRLAVVGALVSFRPCVGCVRLLRHCAARRPAGHNDFARYHPGQGPWLRCWTLPGRIGSDRWRFK